LFSHKEKATLLLEAYRERLGTSEYTEMHFDLHGFLQPMEYLDGLVEPVGSQSPKALTPITEARNTKARIGYANEKGEGTKA
jgi:hypothetical protein